MTDNNTGSYQLQIPAGSGHQVIFVDKNSEKFSYSQRLEVANSASWFQPDPSNIPGVSGTSLFKVIETVPTSEQQVGWDLSIPNKVHLSESLTTWPDQVIPSPIKVEQNEFNNVPGSVFNNGGGHISERNNITNGISPTLPFNAVKQDEFGSLPIATSSQYVSVIKRTPVKKSRRKSVTSQIKQAARKVVEVGEAKFFNEPCPKLTPANKTPRKRSKKTEDRQSLCKSSGAKKCTSANPERNSLALFAEVAIACLSGAHLSNESHECNSEASIGSINPPDLTPEVTNDTLSARMASISTSDGFKEMMSTTVASSSPPELSKEMAFTPVASVSRSKKSKDKVPTPTTPTPKVSKEMVNISIKVMEIPPKENKIWWVDFSRSEPDSNSSSDDPLRKRFAGTIKRAREILSNKVWDTVAEAISVADEVFGIEPIIKTSFRRPEGKPIMIRFISQSDSSQVEGLQHFPSPNEMVISPNNGLEASLSLQNSVVGVVPQITNGASDFALDLSPKKVLSVQSEQDIFLGKSTLPCEELKCVNDKILAESLPMQIEACDIKVENSKDMLPQDDVDSIEDTVDYNALPGSRLNPFYFISRDNFKRILFYQVKTDTHDVPTWIRSKLDSCGFLDVIRDRQHKQESIQPYSDGIVSYCYISVRNQKPVSIKTVYYRASDLGNVKVTMPNYTSESATEGQKFYMFDDQIQPNQTSCTTELGTGTSNQQLLGESSQTPAPLNAVDMDCSEIQNDVHKMDECISALHIAENKITQQTELIESQTRSPTFETSRYASIAAYAEECSKSIIDASIPVSVLPVQSKKASVQIKKEPNQARTKKKLREVHGIKLSPIKTENKSVKVKRLRKNLTADIKINSSVMKSETGEPFIKSGILDEKREVYHANAEDNMSEGKNTEFNAFVAQYGNKQTKAKALATSGDAKLNASTVESQIGDTESKRSKPGDDSNANLNMIKTENIKPVKKMGRPKKLGIALKVGPAFPSKDGDTKGSSVTPKLSYEDAVRSRKWYPSTAEQHMLYGDGRFLILADQDDKPEKEALIYKILMCKNDRQLLKKFKPVELNGRIFHHATDTFVPLFGPLKELFLKYRPVICKDVHRSQNGDNVIEVVKYFCIPRVAPLLFYFDKTKDLYSSLRLVTMIFAREIMQTGYTGKKVTRTSIEYDENYAAAWENVDRAIDERVSTLLEKYGYKIEGMMQVKDFPSIKYFKPAKSETSCLECIPCKSKERNRSAATQVEFKGKPYDRLTFETLESPTPPENFGVCYTCKPRLKLLHKLLHHKWLIYAAIYAWISDLIGELEHDEFLDVNEIGDHIFEEYEWQTKNFFEFQSVLAEVDREIETLEKGHIRQAIVAKTE